MWVSGGGAGQGVASRQDAKPCRTKPMLVPTGLVLFSPTWGGSLEICSVCCMLYCMVRKHYSLQQLSKGSCSLHMSDPNLRVDSR